MCRVAQGLILALDGFASMLIQARVSATTFLILPFESRTIQILVQRVVWLSFVLWRPFFVSPYRSFRQPNQKRVLFVQRNLKVHT